MGEGQRTEADIRRDYAETMEVLAGGRKLAAAWQPLMAGEPSGMIDVIAALMVEVICLRRAEREQREVNRMLAEALAKQGVRLEILAAPAIDLGPFVGDPGPAAGTPPAQLKFNDLVNDSMRKLAQSIQNLGRRTEALERGFSLDDDRET